MLASTHKPTPTRLTPRCAREQWAAKGRRLLSQPPGLRRRAVTWTSRPAAAKSRSTRRSARSTRAGSRRNFATSRRPSTRCDATPNSGYKSTYARPPKKRHNRHMPLENGGGLGQLVDRCTRCWAVRRTAMPATCARLAPGEAVPGEAARVPIHKLARLGQGDFINSFSLSLKPLHNR